MQQLEASNVGSSIMLSSADRLVDMAGSSAQSVRLLLTVPEVAVALGVGRSLVYELLITQQIPSLKIGRARRIPLTVLEGFIARQLTDQCSE